MCLSEEQGRSQTFSFGGATGGASFATREAVNGLCRTFRKRPEKIWEARQNFGGAVAPLGTLLALPLVRKRWGDVHVCPRV